MTTRTRTPPPDRTRPGRGETRFAPGLRTARCRGERGGAVSLLVILMAPVLVLAAVTAAAVPKRLAAQAAADDTARSLASLAAAWRDAQGRGHGAVDWFFPDCGAPARDRPERDPDARGSEQQRICEALTAGVAAGLSARGFDGGTLTGFYTSAYSTAQGDHASSVPCHPGGRAVVADAVHLGLAADWPHGDWAAAQTWPAGTRIGAEAVAAISHPAAGDIAALPACADLLELAPPRTPSQRDSAARRLAESLPARTAFGP